MGGPQEGTRAEEVLFPQVRGADGRKRLLLQGSPSTDRHAAALTATGRRPQERKREALRGPDTQRQSCHPSSHPRRSTGGDSSPDLPQEGGRQDGEYCGVLAGPGGRSGPSTRAGVVGKEPRSMSKPGAPRSSSEHPSSQPTTHRNQRRGPCAQRGAVTEKLRQRSWAARAQTRAQRGAQRLRWRTRRY